MNDDPAGPSPENPGPQASGRRDSRIHPARMGHPAGSVTRPGAPPIYQTAAFDVPDLEVLDAISSGTVIGDIYTRDSNPNHRALAETIALLEGAESGAVFASGMGAAAGIFLTLAGQNDHVILSRSLYGKTMQLAAEMQQKYGLEISWFDPTNPEQLRVLLKSRTRFVLVETVSNPLLNVADISALAEELPDSVPLIVDATFTTPELVRPCLLGASLVFHSASKYLNGHGDVMLGVAAGRAELIRKLRDTASLFGQNAGPFESWLCQRGLRTLGLRMRQICETTNVLARQLRSHPAVRKLYHPLLPDHPSYPTASRLYPRGTGGILTVELAGSQNDPVRQFMKLADTIPFSPTLADARTTISHPATTSHRFLSDAERLSLGITRDLIRISVGLESVDQLLEEFVSVLDQIH